MGPVPRVGEDQKFPGGFVISAERRPIAAGSRRSSATSCTRCSRSTTSSRNSVGTSLAACGFPAATRDRGSRARGTAIREGSALDRAGPFPLAATERATYALPAAAFAEREGSYMNRNDHLQTATLAVCLPWGVRAEGSLFWQMLGRKAFTIPVPYWTISAARSRFRPRRRPLARNRFGYEDQQTRHGRRTDGEDGLTIRKHWKRCPEP